MISFLCYGIASLLQTLTVELIELIGICESAMLMYPDTLITISATLYTLSPFKIGVSKKTWIYQGLIDGGM